MKVSSEEVRSRLLSNMFECLVAITQKFLTTQKKTMLAAEFLGMKPFASMRQFMTVHRTQLPKALREVGQVWPVLHEWCGGVIRLVGVMKAGRRVQYVRMVGTLDRTHDQFHA